MQDNLIALVTGATQGVGFPSALTGSRYVSGVLVSNCPVSIVLRSKPVYQPPPFYIVFSIYSGLRAGQITNCSSVDGANNSSIFMRREDNP
jgi:hypothetical protein